jgi:cation diffusion facilitator family transporter
MKEKNRTQQAKRVTWIGFFVNLALSAGKVFAGIVGHSTAMIADGIHSVSDFVTDIIVVAFIRISDKESDQDHHYGHGKFETFATMLISFALIIVGVGIAWSGIENIYGSFLGETLGEPTYIALGAAIISIITKEWLFWYTLKIGKSINNQAVIANAWHHRSDSFSSFATLAGISGAIFLGEKWRLLDPLAGVIVSFFIVKVAIQIGMPSIRELLEIALPREIQDEILAIIHETPEVVSSHKLKTRKVGNVFIIDVHIQLNKDISFVKSHDIATEVELKLRKKYGDQTQISIHTEPV